MNLMNFKNADLTSPGQKIIAGLLGVGLLALLYVLLPPLVFILKNLWMTVALTIPLVFLIYNYHILWSVLKQASWAMTKKIISSNKLWYMWQGHKWLVEQNNEINKVIQNTTEVEISTKKQLEKLVREANETKETILHEEKKGEKGNKYQLKVLYSKVNLLDKQFIKIEPRVRFIEEQKKGLIEVYNNLVADAEIVKQTIEAKEQEYEMLKSLSTASTTASAVLKRNSPEMIEYEESLKQIEQSINEYTANIENFQRNVLPTLQAMDTKREMDEEAGRRLIEEYKQKRFMLPEEATIVSK
jgi:hypothetical protein